MTYLNTEGIFVNSNGSLRGKKNVNKRDWLTNHRQAIKFEPKGPRIELKILK